MNDVYATGSEEVSPDERKIIRVDFPSPNAGITAALRRAFQEAAEEPSSYDFNELLRQLH